jgi:hypothetical protein
MDDVVVREWWRDLACVVSVSPSVNTKQRHHMVVAILGQIDGLALLEQHGVLSFFFLQQRINSNPSVTLLVPGAPSGYVPVGDKNNSIWRLTADGGLQ